MPDIKWSKWQGKIKVVCCSLPWSAPWSVAFLTRSMTSCQRCAEVQTSQSEASKHVLNITSQAENCDTLKCWRSVFGLATDVCSILIKLLEALWRCREVVLRGGSTMTFISLFLSGCCFKICQILHDKNLWDWESSTVIKAATLTYLSARSSER